MDAFADKLGRIGAWAGHERRRREDSETVFCKGR